MQLTLTATIASKNPRVLPRNTAAENILPTSPYQLIVFLLPSAGSGVILVMPSWSAWLMEKSICKYNVILQIVLYKVVILTYFSSAKWHPTVTLVIGSVLCSGKDIKCNILHLNVSRLYPVFSVYAGESALHWRCTAFIQLSASVMLATPVGKHHVFFSLGRCSHAAAIPHCAVLLV